MYSKYFILPVVLAASALASPAVQPETRQSCSALQVLHLGGTDEQGLGVIGELLSKAIAKAIPGTTTYSVPYNTSAEYSVTVDEGVKLTTDHIIAQASRCPKQKFVLSGYSKGALVIHTMKPSSAVQSKVFSILAYGDPSRNPRSTGPRTWPINSPSINLTPRKGNTGKQNIASYCNAGDPVCEAGGTNGGAHVAYRTDGTPDDAAKFVKDQFRGQAGF